MSFYYRGKPATYDAKTRVATWGSFTFQWKEIPEDMWYAISCAGV